MGNAQTQSMPPKGGIFVGRSKAGSFNLPTARSHGDQNALAVIDMDNTNIRLWQITSVAAAAFVSGAAFAWLIGAGPVPEVEISGAVGATIVILAIVAAFSLGEWQMYALCKSGLPNDLGRAGKRKEAALATATAAWKAIEQLDFQYRDTYEDRMRLCAVYHSNTFGGLIEALASIPAYEMEPTEAGIALAGLKNNLNEIRQAIDAFISEANERNTDIVILNALPALDLQVNKSYAELHYHKLVAYWQE